MTLRAVVIGTGWAGEGHTIALRAAGVEVVAMCGRTPEPAKAMATTATFHLVRVTSASPPGYLCPIHRDAQDLRFVSQQELASGSFIWKEVIRRVKTKRIIQSARKKEMYRAE